MRPIFTIHAGEFLFGERIEEKFPDADLWIPAKDKGIDFLITRPGTTRPTSVQVKMSRDYSPSAASTEFERKQIAGGWFTFSHRKIEESPAEIWSLILISRERRSKPFFINLRPTTLLNKLQAVHGKREKYDLYPWIVKGGTRNLCIEGRGLKKDDRERLAAGNLELGSRDWTDHYDNWDDFIPP